VQLQQGFMQNAVGLAHLLLQQLQLSPRTVIVGRQYQIQIVGAGVNHAERLAEVVNQDTHDGPNPLRNRIGGDIGSECKHVNLNSGVTMIITQVYPSASIIYAGLLQSPSARRGWWLCYLRSETKPRLA
jgi:hypothetical protein